MKECESMRHGERLRTGCSNSTPPIAVRRGIRASTRLFLVAGSGVGSGLRIRRCKVCVTLGSIYRSVNRKIIVEPPCLHRSFEF